MFRHALLSLAMLAYPSDFRRHYRNEMLADFDDSQTGTPGAVFDIIGGGIGMRVENIAHDLAHAAGRLRRAPLFVAIVVLTFALGIGANVAVFSVLNAVLLKPLPYPNAGRLVVVRNTDSHTGSVSGDLSVPAIADFRAQSKTLEFIAGSSGDTATLNANGKPEQLGGFDVMPNFFAALGTPAELGRFLNESDERPGVHNVVVSDAFWRRYFNADATAIGKTISLSGVAYTVVGVAPAGFRFPAADRGQLQDGEFFEVQPETAPPNQRGATYLATVAALRPGVSIAQANAELAIISKRLQRTYPGFESTSNYWVRPLRDVITGNASRVLWTVFVAVLGILVITCANVSNMVLSTASSREREFAMRSALGATRRRLASQVLVETGLLATIGAVIGVALAYATLNVLRSSLSSFPRADSIAIDSTALVYALAVVIVATLLSGFWPVRALSRGDLQLLLKSAGRGGDAAASNRARSTMVVVEVSIALALVVLSGLMVRSYYVLTHDDLGIRTQGVSIAGVFSLADTRYKSLQQRWLFQRRLLNGVRAIPGVEATAVTIGYPLGNIDFNFNFAVAGKHYAPGTEPLAAMSSVSGDYFHAFGIPVLRGRTFNERDGPASMPVAIVNRTFERKYAPQSGAVGMRINTPGFNGTAHATRTIIGVVGDARDHLSSEATPTYYQPAQQAPSNFFSLVIRSNGIPQNSLATQIAHVVASIDPTMAPPLVQNYAELVDRASLHERSAAAFLASLALVALLLALSGIFGVVSYSVTQRYREFGVRMALGAMPHDVVLDVLRRSLAVTALGIAIGSFIAMLGGRVVEPQLYHTSPFDPLTFATVILLLLACASVAATLPALRATRIDPATALRYE